MNPWIFTIIVPIGIWIYFYFKRKYSHWTSLGVVGPPPTFPFGNIWDFIRIGQIKLEPEWLRKYGKVYGIYLGGTPVLTIADVDLIKQVTVKDFHAFVNRDVARFEHEIYSTNLFHSEDEQWRRIRAITSPSFSTGKLKGMHEMMQRCVQNLVKYFDHLIESNGGKTNVKEVITGFTIDVIASTSFATETDANDPNESRRKENVFLDNATNLLSMNPLYMASFFMMPKWFNKAIGNQVAANLRAFKFFIDLSKEIIKQRKAEEKDCGKMAKRNDLVQLLIDAFVYEDELNSKDYDKLTTTEDDSQDIKLENPKENSIKKRLSENEIIAQCILFFIAGFETTSNTITNCLYHLALYPDIQERLHLELTEKLVDLEENSNEYLEVVNNRTPYLEAVIKETLRIAPPVTRLLRRVGVDGYKLGGITLEKNAEIHIASYAVQMSPEYYPEPEKFNPTRFMPENKHLLVPYSYLPFGSGPRNCLGMRFAYQEIKLCLASLVQRFQFATTPETKIPLDYAKFGGCFVKDVPLKVSKRAL